MPVSYWWPLSFTRYDGWIFAAAAWLFVTAGWSFARARKSQFWADGLSSPRLLIAAPAIWIAYNAAIFGDPLDFLRGPYSARAIEARTSVPGSPPHPGAHNMRVAALYFLKAAEMGAVPLRYGNKLLWLSIAGALAALVRFRRSRIWPAFLLWLPLPFYAYAIAYGSVPIFIPLWWPFSWYNTRYGMEMLPAFALFAACLFGVLLKAKPKLERWVVATLVSLIVVNSIVLLRAGPLVFEEAVMNSRTRIAFEHALTNVLLGLPETGVVLMYTSQNAGAVQQSGISLHRVVNEGDYREWQQALEDPARSASVVDCCGRRSRSPRRGEALRRAQVDAGDLFHRPALCAHLPVAVVYAATSACFAVKRPRNRFRRSAVRTKMQALEPSWSGDNSITLNKFQTPDQEFAADRTRTLTDLERG